MQEVRIRLWRARGSSEQVSETNTSYVYRTASSAALDVLRRRRSRQADRHDEIDEGPVAGLTATGPDPHGMLEGSEATGAPGPSTPSPNRGAPSSGCTSPGTPGKRSPR
jgi:DNA-directed RNA polymerase specialized sigma24 family protein